MQREMILYYDEKMPDDFLQRTKSVLRRGMISYKLAKQLKEARFPMKLALPDSKEIWGGTDTNGIVYQYPTLSELIEACGDGIRGLIREPQSDGSISWWCESKYSHKCQNHNSPEEAVAKLWLKLSTCFYSKNMV